MKYQPSCQRCGYDSRSDGRTLEDIFQIVNGFLLSPRDGQKLS